MSVTLKNVECTEKSVVHSLPCNIHADSQAKVSQYFKTTGNEDLIGSLRGYPLNGKNIKLPSGYTGLILETTDNCDGEKTQYTCRNKFDSINYWNWDQLPSRNDKFIACLDWLDVSKAIHDNDSDTG